MGQGGWKGLGEGQGVKGMERDRNGAGRWKERGRRRAKENGYHWEIKGRFRKRVVLANVPSFRFSFWGNIRRNRPFGNHPFVNTKNGYHWEIKGRFPKGWFWRTYPRSGFRSGGTSAETTLLRNHPNLRTPEVIPVIPVSPRFSFGQGFWTLVVLGGLPYLYIPSLTQKSNLRNSTICPKTITLQHLIFGQLILGAVT